MKYYKVPVDGNGTYRYPYRPDIPQDEDFIGTQVDDHFLLVVPESLPSALNMYELTESQLEAELADIDPNIAKVLRWSFSQTRQSEGSGP